MTHGHILALHHVWEVVRATDGCEAMQQKLREETLDEELKPSVIAYDLANLAEAYMRRM